MTPDQAASRLAMQGVAVWRRPRPAEHGASEHYYKDAPSYLVGDREPGRWFPEAVASALVDVAEAARAFSKASPKTWRGHETERALYAALDRLDAAKAASSSAEGTSS